MFQLDEKKKMLSFSLIKQEEFLYTWDSDIQIYINHNEELLLQF